MQIIRKTREGTNSDDLSLNVGYTSCSLNGIFRLCDRGLAEERLREIKVCLHNDRPFFLDFYARDSALLHLPTVP